MTVPGHHPGLHKSNLRIRWSGAPSSAQIHQRRIEFALPGEQHPNPQVSSDVPRVLSQNLQVAGYGFLMAPLDPGFIGLALLRVERLRQKEQESRP